MDRIQFLAWVNDPRTEAELTAQISLMGQTAPAAGSPLDDFRDVLRSHAAAQPAAWTVPAGQIPAGWTPPAAVPAAPTPVTPAGAPAPAAAAPAPAPAPAAATPPPPRRRGRINGGNAPFLIVGSVLVLGAIALFLLFGPFAGDKLTDVDNGVTTVTTAPSPTATAQATASPEATTATATATPPANVKSWPSSAEEAAAIFGGTPNRWETTAEGGWHMREEPFSVVLNPQGRLAEGYFDTKPGRNPQCFAFTVPMGVQGATVWQEEGTRANATALQMKMAVPKWDDGSSNHPCEVMTQ